MKELFKAILPVYTLLLIYMMLFGMGRAAGEVGNLQLTPFRSIEHFSSSLVPIKDYIVNIICNILVFMPFGFLGLYHKFFNPIYIKLPLFVLFITLVELTQHFSGRGVADIDDVILNTFGMLSGYLVYQCYQLLNKVQISKASSTLIEA